MWNDISTALTGSQARQVDKPIVSSYIGRMGTREKVLSMRAADPTVRGSVMAETLGVSRQRVDQILRSEGLVTKGKAKIGIEHRAEYLCWWNMLDRCLNPGCKTFKYYGARGITVCQRWRDFGRFLDDMGSRPSPKHSIDRKDNDGNYEPSNCHWATVARTAMKMRRKMRSNRNRSLRPTR